MDLGISGKRAAVAAGSAGLGLGTAIALANEGVHVAICGRDAARVAEAAAQVGHGCVGLVADVSSTPGAAGFVNAASEALGGVDILIPNAGGPKPGTFASTDLEDYEPALRLNLLSTVAMCKAAVPAMQARGWGRVVAITSVSVRQPIANLILSNTARAGVTGFLKTLALEVARSGVTVNSVQPGYHLTERIKGLGHPADIGRAIPVGFAGDPGDFGRLVAMLCSEHARFVTGTHVPIDGGTYLGLQ
ncbi:MAG: SDR family oxidoreductase [Acidimicrobiales bacterium]